MNFEDEVYEYIRSYEPDAYIIQSGYFPHLSGAGIYVPSRNILFHTVPLIPDLLAPLPSCYFQEKTVEYASLGIQLVHLWQDHWIQRKTIVCSRISALLGGEIHIHARQTTVKPVNKDDIRLFMTENHLQGYVSSRYTYGLFAGDKMLAAAAFSAGRTFGRGRSFELLRYANLIHHRVVGGMGKLIAHFIRDRQPDDIMSYADLDWASGRAYQALNFQLVAVTPPQSFWIHPGEMIRYYPHRLPSTLLQSFHDQTGIKSVHEFLNHLGYIRIYNSGNLKYIRFLRSDKVVDS